jgi:hypothetical protein
MEVLQSTHSSSTLIVVRPRLSRCRVGDDDAQDHAAKEQHDEHQGHHGAAMPLVRQALSSLGLPVTFFAMKVRLWAEYTGYGLSQSFLGLLKWLVGGIVSVSRDGSMVLNVGLGNRCVLGGLGKGQ